MPKQKTNRSVRKRFKLTKGRKVRRNKAFRRHLLAGRTTKRKRQLRREARQTHHLDAASEPVVLPGNELDDDARVSGP